MRVTENSRAIIATPKNQAPKFTTSVLQTSNQKNAEHDYNWWMDDRRINHSQHCTRVVMETEKTAWYWLGGLPHWRWGNDLCIARIYTIVMNWVVIHHLSAVLYNIKRKINDCTGENCNSSCLILQWNLFITVDHLGTKPSAASGPLYWGGLYIECMVFKFV